jgi:hypothetical protein
MIADVNDAAALKTIKTGEDKLKTKTFSLRWFSASIAAPRAYAQEFRWTMENESVADREMKFYELAGPSEDELNSGRHPHYTIGHGAAFGLARTGLMR